MTNIFATIGIASALILVAAYAQDSSRAPRQPWRQDSASRADVAKN